MKRVLRDHFIPHEGNEYAPHILQKAAMTAMLGLVLLSFTMANLQALIWVNVDWLVSSILPAVVVSETNEEREDEALGELARNPTLDVAAQLKAEHMAELGYFAHYAPDGTSPWHWFRAANYSFVHAGENLAIHFNDSRQVVRAWMDSPTHRANIMNGNYTEIGIGVAEGVFEGRETLFVVQLFGTPAAPVVAAAEPRPDTITVVTEQVTEPNTPVSTNETVTNEQVAAADESVSEEPASTNAPVPAPDTVLPDTTQVAVAPTPAPESTPAPVVEELVEASTTIASTEPVEPSDQFISTSTGGTPATIDTAPPQNEAPNRLFSFATSPQLVLQFLYLALGLFVLGALTLSLLIEFRRHQPLQIAYSFGLLLIMGGLYYVQNLVTAGATIL